MDKMAVGNLGDVTDRNKEISTRDWREVSCGRWERWVREHLHHGGRQEGEP